MNNFSDSGAWVCLQVYGNWLQGDHGKGKVGLSVRATEMGEVGGRGEALDWLFACKR